MKRLSLCAFMLVLILLAAGQRLMPNGASVNAVGGPTVIATIPAGVGPFGVGVNANTNRVYVSNGAADSVSIIDGGTNGVVDTVAVVGQPPPRGLAVNPNTNRIYVNVPGSSSVSVIDGASDSVVRTVPVDVGPLGVAVNPNTSRIYVVNEQSGSVTVIDGETDTVVATIPVGSAPQDAGVNPATNRVYVSNAQSSNVSVIDGASNSVTGTVPLVWGVSGVAVNPNTDRIYVSEYYDGHVAVIDGGTNAVVTTVLVGDHPRGIAVNPITNRIYVTNYFGNTVSVIDGATNTVVATVPVGSSPVDVDVNPNTSRVYVSNWTTNDVSVIEDSGGTPPPSGEWSLISATNAPAARYSHSVVYDTSRNRLLLFGGNNTGDDSGYLGDLWQYPLPSGPWTQLSPTPDPVNGSPGPRRGHSAVWDPSRNQMLIFGGHYCWGCNHNDVWAYDSGANTWTLLPNNGAPPFQGYDYASVWDPANDRMLVFGGYDQGQNLYHNELWQYSRATNTWSQLGPTGGPPSGRQGAAAVWDTLNSRMLVFGGASNAGVFNDLWSYKPSTNSWQNLSPSGGPSPRGWVGAGWDPTSHDMLIFGGHVYGQLGDTWAYSVATNTWQQLATSGDSPEARGWPAAAGADGQMYLYGGSTEAGQGILQDFWVLCSGTCAQPPQDTDGDGVPDASDVCPNDAANDADNDGICAGSGFLPPKTGDQDNCPDTPPGAAVDANGCSQAQVDQDGDGYCDPGKTSSRWCTGSDNCASKANAGQDDIDGDGVGDLCDNCPAAPNSGQADTDRDGIGDACEGLLIAVGRVYDAETGLPIKRANVGASCAATTLTDSRGLFRLTQDPSCAPSPGSFDVWKAVPLEESFLSINVPMPAFDSGLPRYFEVLVYPHRLGQYGNLFSVIEGPEADCSFPCTDPPDGWGVTNRATSPIVLIHGIGGDARGWDKLRPLLSTETWAISYPNREHIELGAGALADAFCRIEAYRKGSSKILDCSEPTAKLRLVAHSMGGLEARAYAQGLALDYRATALDVAVRSCANQSTDQCKRVTYRQDVMNLLMIGTPNHGSHAANCLYQYGWGCAWPLGGLLATFLGQPMDSDALQDLQIGSTFLERLNGVPGVSDLNGDGVPDLPDLDGDHGTGVLSEYAVIAGTAPYFGWRPPADLGRLESDDHDDAIVAISSASLLEFGVPMGYADAHHLQETDPSVFTQLRAAVEDLLLPASVHLGTNFEKGILLLKGSPVRDGDSLWLYHSSDGSCTPGDRKVLRRDLEPGAWYELERSGVFWYTGKSDGLFSEASGSVGVPTDDGGLGFPTSRTYCVVEMEPPGVLERAGRVAQGVELRGLTTVMAPYSPPSDFDGDGLSNETEQASGTDPLNDDTDSDGLCDGHSPPGCASEDLDNDGVVDAGETDPRNWDTDGDGLSDGLERGLVEPEALDTDSSSPHWQPDADPSTTSDPLNPDTDRDGILDGVEDANHNGAVDPGETNAANPDTDGDGFSDVDEIARGSNPANPASTPEVCDVRDNDLDGLIDDGYQSVIVGFSQPVNDPIGPGSPMSVFKRGSTVPLKFKLLHCNGQPYTDAEAQAVVSSGHAGLFIATGNVIPSLVVDEATTSTQADQGNLFRYDVTGHQFIYNWGTKSYAGGGQVYTVVAIVVDAGNNVSMHGVQLALK